MIIVSGGETRIYLSELIKMQAKTYQVHGNSDIFIGYAENLSHNISQYYSICILIFYSYQPPRTNRGYT